MKSERRPFPRSAQAFRSRSLGNRDRTLAESKCQACGQIVDTMTDPPLEQGETAVVFPYPMEGMRGRIARKRPSDVVAMENLLHFSQQLYAHALTLQEMIRNQGEVKYEVLRPRYDRQAAQQFEIFYHTFKGSSGYRK